VTPRRLALAAASIGLLARLAFAFLPLEAHLILLEDDAWMVTAIARNVAAGLGITADGVQPTTGFQPLHPLTLGVLPYLAWRNDPAAGFTASLVLCALLASAVCWPLWHLARHLGGERAGTVAVVLYALNPTLIRLMVNGMETALGALLLTTLAWMALRSDLRRTRDVIGLAMLSALAILARLDAALCFAAIGASAGLRGMLAFRQAPAAQRWVDASAWLAGATGYGLLTLIMLTPYFAFNYQVGGSLGPSSGAALSFMQSYRGSFNLSNGLSAIYQTAVIYLDWIPSLWIKAAIVLGGVTGTVLTLRGQLMRALPLWLFLPVPALYYGYMLQQIRERYFVGTSIIVIALLGWIAATLLERRPRLRWPLISALIVIIAANSIEAVGFYDRMRHHPELTQPTSYRAAVWIRDHLPADVIIGAKNSGIYQYYAERTVVNIDGKLNHDILPQLEQRALLEYLRHRGITHLVDREATMARHVMFYSAEFGPAPMHRTPTLVERLTIYGRILQAVLGFADPPQLDDPASFVPQRPFSDVTRVVVRFERPNDRDNPVVVYQLLPADAR
jgi:hypothetical protein